MEVQEEQEEQQLLVVVAVQDAVHLLLQLQEQLIQVAAVALVEQILEVQMAQLGVQELSLIHI